MGGVRLPTPAQSLCITKRSQVSWFDNHLEIVRDYRQDIIAELLDDDIIDMRLHEQALRKVGLDPYPPLRNQYPLACIWQHLEKLLLG